MGTDRAAELRQQELLDRVRAALAERNIALPDEDVESGTVELDVLLQKIEKLRRADVAALEPTTYPNFDD